MNEMGIKELKKNTAIHLPVTRYYAAVVGIDTTWLVSKNVILNFFAAVFAVNNRNINKNITQFFLIRKYPSGFFILHLFVLFNIKSSFHLSSNIQLLLF